MNSSDVSPAVPPADPDAALNILAQLAGALGGDILSSSLGGRGPRVSQVRHAEVRFRALVEQIRAVTFMAALDGGLNEVYVSPQIEALLGYRRLHPDDRALWSRAFAEGIVTGGPFRAECRFLARDGSIVWVRGEARLERDDRGRALFLQGHQRRGPGYEIEVRDDGVGLPAGFVPSTSESLGLELVRTLVRQLDGGLRASSSDGGTAFCIRLPPSVVRRS